MAIKPPTPPAAPLPAASPDDTTAAPAKRGRGRPPTGHALDSAAKQRAQRQRNAAAGRREVAPVLSPAAAQALARWEAAGFSVSQAISAALLAAPVPTRRKAPPKG